MSRAAIAVAAGLALLAAACGGPRSAATAAQPGEKLAALAYARCMRAHGVANFPDPDPRGDFPAFRPAMSKPAVNAADGACRHLLSSGGTATPQERRQKLLFGVKVAECLRTHGYPGFPDPTRLGSQHLPPGVDGRSPQFQAAENGCERQARQALGLP